MKKIILFIALFSVIIIAAATLRKNHIVTRQEAVESFTNEYSKFMDMDGFKIHYTDRGEGIPVIMFHGFAGSHNNWEKLIPLFPEGYRIVALDLPGFGLSEFPEEKYNEQNLMDFYAPTISLFLDNLEIDSAYILGNSMGGYMSWELALRDERVKKVVLLNSMGYSTQEIKPMLARLMTLPGSDFFIQKGMPMAFAKKGAQKCFGDDSKIESHGVQAFYNFLNTEGVLYHTKQLASSVEYPDTSRIEQIKQPVLIIWGDQDKIIPVEHAHKFKRDIPNSRLIIYEGSGHIPMIENPQETIRDVLNFFNENHVPL